MFVIYVRPRQVGAMGNATGAGVLLEQDLFWDRRQVIRIFQAVRPLGALSEVFLSNDASVIGWGAHLEDKLAQGRCPVLGKFGRPTCWSWRRCFGL